LGDDGAGPLAEGTVQVAVQLGGSLVQPARLGGRRLVRGQVALLHTDPHARADQQQAADEVWTLSGDAGGEVGAVGGASQ